MQFVSCSVHSLAYPSCHRRSLLGVDPGCPPENAATLERRAAQAGKEGELTVHANTRMIKNIALSKTLK